MVVPDEGILITENGKNNSQQIFDFLFSQIKNGVLKPGDKLPTERTLSETLGVSRNSLREALKALSYIGLVSTRQGGGTYVTCHNADFLSSVLKYITVIDDNLIYEVLQVRGALESEAARLATENATNEEINKIEEIITKRENLTQSMEQNPEKYREELNELDSKFHMAISKASGNSVIFEFISAISDIFRIHQNKAAEWFQSPSKSNTFHRKIFNAMKNRNPELAKEIMFQHIESISTAIFSNTDKPKR